MTATIQHFTRALLTPDLSLATLSDARAVTDRNGMPRMVRTTRFAEAEIEWRGERWLAAMPLTPAALPRIERTASVLRRMNTEHLTQFRILPEEMLAVPVHGCINAHASILPKYRGAAPINRAILDGEKETGVTVMHMAKECDAGDMILVKKQAIRPDETAEDLFKELAVLGADAIAEAIVEIQNGTAQRVPQDESQATYAPMLSRELSPIDWMRSSTQIIDQIRALIPWPCAAASILGANTKIFRAVPLGETKDAPGTLCARKKGIEAACGDGKSILITELQPDGGKRMAANAFLNGKRIAAGTVLDA